MPSQTWVCGACGNKNPPLTEVCRDCAHPSEETKAKQACLPVASESGDAATQTTPFIFQSVSHPDDDRLIMRIVVVLSSLMLAGAGCISIVTEYHWGTTKLGRVVELYGIKAIGMGVLLISFSAFLLMAITGKKTARWLWVSGICGIALSLWLGFLK